MGAQIIFAVISYLVYISSDYKFLALPLYNPRTIKFSILIGLGIGILYVIVSYLIPGFAISVPILPSAISDSLNFLVVSIVAPIIETIFFFGALLVLIWKTKIGRNHPFLTLITIGIIASLFHLGAYVVGIYDLPTKTAIGVFSGNFGTFLSAFIFFTLSGFVILWKKTQCLLVGMIIHFFPNVMSFIQFAVIFGGSG